MVFYDKIKDLEKARQSEKRAIEKDNALQMHLFPGLRKSNKLEILRMEVRLNKRQKMKQLLAKLGIKSDLSLKSLFKPAISKKVLIHYLDELENKRPALLDFKFMDDKALLTALILNNHVLPAKKIMQIYGILKALEIVNIRELKEMFPKHSKLYWYTFIKDIEKINFQTTSDFFAPLKDAIE